MKKFGFCVSLVNPPLQAWSLFYENLVPLHYRTRGVKCVEVADSPGRAGDRRWVGTHSWRLDRTVNGQDVNSTSGIHSWNLGQSTRLRDLRRTINRFVTVEYPTHRSPTLSIVHGDGFTASVPCPFSDLHFLVYLQRCDRPSRAIPLRLRPFSPMDTLQYTVHSSLSTIIAYVMLILAKDNDGTSVTVWLYVSVHSLSQLSAQGFFCAHKTGFEFYCARWVIKDRIFSYCVCSAAVKVLCPEGRGGW